MKLAHYHRGDMYLPVDVYRRGGQEITLVGMTHMAPEAFYREVDTLLRQYDERGDRILVEGIGVHDDYAFDVTTLSEFDRSLVAKYDRMRETQATFIRLMAEGTRTVYQLDVLPHWSSWERADIKPLEMMRLYPDVTVTDINPESEEMLRWAFEHKPQVAEAIYSLLRNVPRLARVLSPAYAWGSRHSIVLGHRNRIAVLSALSSTANAVLPWSAAHLPGMRSLLMRNGFDRASRAWLLAMPGKFPGGVS